MYIQYIFTTKVEAAELQNAVIDTIIYVQMYIFINYILKLNCFWSDMSRRNDGSKLDFEILQFLYFYIFIFIIFNFYFNCKRVEQVCCVRVTQSESEEESTCLQCHLRSRKLRSQP